MKGLDRFAEAQIIVVDDEEANVLLLERLLHQAGFQDVIGTTDPRQGLGLCAGIEPDLVILDLLMPHLDGFQFLTALARFVPEGTYLPVLVITADATREARQRALTMGANDFLTKPFDGTEVLLRARNLLETRFLHMRLGKQNEELEEMVEHRTRELGYKAQAYADLANEKHDLLIKLHEAQMQAPVRGDSG